MNKWWRGIRVGAFLVAIWFCTYLLELVAPRFDGPYLGIVAAALLVTLGPLVCYGVFTIFFYGFDWGANYNEEGRRIK